MERKQPRTRLFLGAVTAGYLCATTNATVTHSLHTLIALALTAGCAQRASTPARVTAPQPAATAPVAGPVPEQQAQARGPLASLASDALVVLPVQRVAVTVPGWTEKVGDPKAYLSSVDDEIAFAVRERAIRGKWAFAPELARSARRNPTYAVDPYTIAIENLAPVERDADKIIAEPLSGQLRAFAGLFGARYAFIPVDLRVASDASGGGRATLHVVVVDTRSAKLMWKGDVSGDVAREFSPAIAAGLAGRVADLFITPAR